MSNIYDDRGIYLGSVDENGYMYDSSGTYLGSIRSDGSIYDDTGSYQGVIRSNGYIYLHGSYIGLITEEGYIYQNSTYVGHIDGYRGPNAGSKTTASPSAAPKPHASRRSGQLSAASVVSSAAESNGFCGAIVGGTVLVIIFAIVAIVTTIVHAVTAVLQTAGNILFSPTAVVLLLLAFASSGTLCLLRDKQKGGQTATGKQLPLLFALNLAFFLVWIVLLLACTGSQFTGLLLTRHVAAGLLLSVPMTILSWLILLCIKNCPPSSTLYGALILFGCGAAATASAVLYTTEALYTYAYADVPVSSESGYTPTGGGTSDVGTSGTECDPDYLLGYAYGKWYDLDSDAWIQYNSDDDSIEFGLDASDYQYYNNVRLFELSSDEAVLDYNYCDYETENWDCDHYVYYLLSMYNPDGTACDLHLFQSRYIEQGSFDVYDPETGAIYSFGVDASEEEPADRADLEETSGSTEEETRSEESENPYESVTDLSTYETYDSSVSSASELDDRFSFSYPAELFDDVEEFDLLDPFDVELSSTQTNATATFHCRQATDSLSYCKSFYEDTSDSLYDPQKILYNESCSDGAARYIVTGYGNEEHTSEIYELGAFFPDDTLMTIHIFYDVSDGNTDELQYMVECMYRMCGFSNSSQSARSYDDYLSDR